MLNKIAGILFVAGEEGVTLAELEKLFNLSKAELISLLADLDSQIKQQTLLPIDLVHYGERYLYVTQAELEPLIESYAQSPLQQKLSRPAIETLAIIAYRQPVTRMTIDEIRGVSSQAMLQKLMRRDLVKEVGKLEAPGRPILYGVTEYFLNYFALSSIEDLPPIEDLALNSQTASEELFSLKKWEVTLFDQAE